jgi:DNA-binding transcriptional LysR family regulator
MDLIAACQAFVSVSERGSFTVGAAAARVPQSVASRRIAALEERLGDRLFDRSSRKAALTTFGREMLPAAKRLVRTAASLEADAERARTRTLRLAMPAISSTVDLARLVAEARRMGVRLEVTTADPAERADQVRSVEAQAALVPVPPGEAVWSVPLGIARADAPQGGPFFLDTIRQNRSDRSEPVHVWIQPEDDVPSIRDRLTRVRDSLGLAPTQVAVAPGLTAAVADVLAAGDLLLCSPGQALALGFAWQSLGELHLVRAYDVAASDAGDADRLRTKLLEPIARCVGGDDEEGDR